jgi:5-methylcytosine-specific restriction endonuclease McrA
MPADESKTCTKCGEAKPLDAYYKQKDCRDGLRPDCKACNALARHIWREANRDAVRERKRKAYLANPERDKARARAHYAANREAHNATSRAWYYANRELALAYSAKRKALKRGVERQPYTRREIYDRDGGLCRICGVALPYEPNAFHIDHIVPLILLGPDTPANVQLACPACNRRKWSNLEGQIHFAV